MRVAKITCTCRNGLQLPSLYDRSVQGYGFACSPRLILLLTFRSLPPSPPFFFMCLTATFAVSKIQTILSLPESDRLRFPLNLLQWCSGQPCPAPPRKTTRACACSARWHDGATTARSKVMALRAAFGRTQGQTLDSACMKFKEPLAPD